MPRQRRMRRRPMRVPRRRMRMTNTLFIENIVLPCPMSSTINNFPWAYNKITPTLAASIRAVNLIRLELQIPPVTSPGIFQILLVDPVDDTLYPVNIGAQLSLTNTTRVNVRIPSKYLRNALPNSSQVAFNFTFRFPSNQTFTSNVMAKMIYRLVPDTLAVPPGRLDDFETLNIA
jgi:hypothetical protein